MKLGKFVIPNPFGPMEEPRFTAYLMKTWKEGKPAAVKTPDYVRDNIHVDLLAATYSDFVDQLVAASSEKSSPSPPLGVTVPGGSPSPPLEERAGERRPLTCHNQLLRCNPSGYIESQGAFALRVAREVKARTNWACEVELGTQTDFTEPLVRINSEPATRLVHGWSEAKAWDAFVKYYRR